MKKIHENRHMNLVSLLALRGKMGGISASTLENIALVPHYAT